MIMKQIDVVALGTTTMDKIGLSNLITDSHFTTQIRSMKKYFGGRGPNFAVFSKKSGAKTMLVSVVGDDDDGITYMKYLRKMGVDTSGIYEQSGASTDTFFMFKEKEKFRAFFYPGSDHNSKQLKEHTRKAILSEKYKVLYCTWPMPQLNMLALSLKKPSRSALHVFAPGQNFYLYTKKEAELCLKNTDIFILNEHEYGIAAKHYGSATAMIKKFDMCAVIVTFGGKGTVIVQKEGKIHVPSFAADKVVDTTGAGDAFAASLIANFVKNKNLWKSARIASAVASFVVEDIGPQTRIPTTKEVNMRMKKNKILKVNSQKLLNFVK